MSIIPLSQVTLDTVGCLDTRDLEHRADVSAAFSGSIPHLPDISDPVVVLLPSTVSLYPQVTTRAVREQVPRVSVVVLDLPMKCTLFIIRDPLATVLDKKVEESKL